MRNKGLIFRKLITRNILILSLAFLALSCSDDDAGIAPNNEINDFVWSAMNMWYFWQGEVDNLLDSKKQVPEDYNSFLSSYSSPQALFEDLKFGDDRFSFMTDDYDELQNLFRGVTKSFGYDFGVVEDDPNNVYSYVRYVVPNSPAFDAGLKRGDIFNKVNGQKLTKANFEDLLFDVESYTLSKASISNGVVSDTNQTVSLTAIEIDENPVFLSKVISLPGGKKIGYLVYTQFIDSYNDEVLEVFNEFQNQNIDELILDLRYNLGGSISTAASISSLIYSTDITKVQSIFTHSEKQTAENYDIFFDEKIKIYDNNNQVIREEPIQTLGLNNLTVLVSGSTASASEYVINVLNPYIDVKLIGTKTIGKNEGSVTLYDAPELDYRSSILANENHKYALQPIIAKFSNSVGFRDYEAGFTPDVVLNEANFLEDMKELGDPEELLLSKALEDYCLTCFTVPARPRNDFVTISDRKSKNPFFKVMTVDELIKK